MPSSLPAYIDDTPTYHVSDGHIRITMGHLVLVMPVHVFMDGMARAEAEIAKWHLRELAKGYSNVVPLECRA